MYIPQNFLPRSRQKLLRSAPGQSFPSVAVMPLAAKVLKKVMVNTGGNKRRHCCKVSDEAAFCLIQRPYISKTLLTRRISPRGSP
ncbi:TPA: hypothetical protein ACJHCK_004910 [Escherichia coli]